MNKNIGMSPEGVAHGPYPAMSPEEMQQTFGGVVDMAVEDFTPELLEYAQTEHQNWQHLDAIDAALEEGRISDVHATELTGNLGFGPLGAGKGWHKIKSPVTENSGYMPVSYDDTDSDREGLSAHERVVAAAELDDLDY